MLRRNRPVREPFEEGDWVLYWRRKGGNLRRERGRWYGPARIVQIEGRRVVWLVHANQLVRASPEQLRPASMREWQGVKDSEEAMHPVKDWMRKVSMNDFFDLESEELPPPHDGPEELVEAPSSGYSPSVLEPEVEEPGMNDGVVDPSAIPVPDSEMEDGVEVPVPSDDELLFGDTVNFCELSLFPAPKGLPCT